MGMPADVGAAGVGAGDVGANVRQMLRRMAWLVHWWADRRTLDMTFYCLLHLQENEHSAVNFKALDFDDQIKTYVRCAVNLSRSLALEDQQLVVLTNRQDKVRAVAEAVGGQLSVQEIVFITKVPQGTRFYSAHFKLDCYRYFATLSSPDSAPFAALIDIDTICANPLPASFMTNVRLGQPMAYDISDQALPAYGEAPIRTDLKRIHGMESEGRWYGGEFICAPPAFYGQLMEVIDRIYDNYIAHLDVLHHVGDEAVTSAAFEVLARQGVAVADAGTLGIVGRYWNCRLRHPQRSFDYLGKAAILHLPHDKPFLAGLARRPQLSHADFARLYDGYRRDALVRRLGRMVTAVQNGFRGFRTHVSNPLLERLGLQRLKTRLRRWLAA